MIGTMMQYLDDRPAGEVTVFHLLEQEGPCQIGNWFDASGKPMPKLAGALDIDLSATPFTNTIAIRRLKLRAGQSADIVTVYILVHAEAGTAARPTGLTLSTDAQRYTCLVPRKRYRYESIDSDFTRDIELDRHALVVTYPGLFRRLL
jgi:hypothetical protein